MTIGSFLYLLMCLATFGGFSAVLAHVSRQQSQPQPKTSPADENNDDALTA